MKFFLWLIRQSLKSDVSTKICCIFFQKWLKVLYCSHKHFVWTRSYSSRIIASKEFTSRSFLAYTFSLIYLQRKNSKGLKSELLEPFNIPTMTRPGSHSCYFKMGRCTVLHEVHNISTIPNRYDWKDNILQHVNVPPMENV